MAEYVKLSLKFFDKLLSEDALALLEKVMTYNSFIHFCIYVVISSKVKYLS